jgi:cephalosporin hydroxylase
MSAGARIDLSIVICAFNMARELPRTLYTLSREYQQGAMDLDWEVVILDNGSQPPVDLAALQAIVPGVTITRPEMIKTSPAAAINAAMRPLQGRMIGLWIDGARLASPGIVRHAFEAWRADPTKAIGTLAFHLGQDVQMRSVFQGYDASTEDALLDAVDWRQDGYRLFDISVLAGSSSTGWFGCINETNGLFMDRALWDELGGLDERFEAKGGGFVNLDLWERAVAASQGHPWMLLGEGTFHQVHGGVATNGTAADRAPMRAEYAAIHGRPFSPPTYQSRYVGSLDHSRFAKGFPSPADRRRKVHSVRRRHFRVDLPTATLAGIQRGTLRTRYKGLRLAKNPFDLVLYLKLLGDLRPATVIEVGTSQGGSAAWLIDQCRALDLESTRLITIDIAPPTLELAGVQFFSGDATRPEESFPTAIITAAPHPWLVIEDSAHSYQSTSRTLAYFDRLLQPGDMLVVEDGVLADLDGDVYRKLDDGPNRAVAEFLDRTGQRYTIDESLCDFYGHNLTYAPNAWLRCRAAAASE